MNRAERRSKKKNVEWLTKLAPDKQRIIAELVKDAARVESREATERMLEQVETCIAASITKNLDDSITFEEIVQVLKDTNEFLLENAEFVHKFRGEWKKKLDNIEPQIVEKMEGMLKTGATKKEIVKTMRKEFKDITNAHIYNAFKAAQMNIRKDKTEEVLKDVIGTDFLEVVDSKEAEPVKAEVVQAKEMKETKEKEIEEFEEYEPYEPTILEQLWIELDATRDIRADYEEELEKLQEKAKKVQENIERVNKKIDAVAKAINVLNEVME